MVRLNEEIPVLTLPDAEGREHSTWAYKHRQPLVLVFADEDAAVTREFARRYADYRAANAEVIAILRAAPREPLPFPVMVDADGSASRRYAERTPAVLVTDAFGTLEGRFEGSDPDHERILSLIFAAEMRCPECGVAEWPSEQS